VRKLESSKTQDDTLNEIGKFSESFDNRLTSENLRLSECYVERQFYVFVRFVISGNAVKQRSPLRSGRWVEVPEYELSGV
jgi:hypothetical protein